MDFLRRNAKRIAIDTAGYFLIVAGVATGWLPGPGGIPLILAGLGLLSINNAWAKHLREWTLLNGGKLVRYLFPRNPKVEWAYDIIVMLLFLLTTVLAIRHSSVWEVSAATFAFFIALFIALTNRDRLNRLRRKRRP